MITNPKIILASSSSARKTLLERLDVNFSCMSPYIDETLHLGETHKDACQRLAIEKAQAVARLLNTDHHLIIGSDQIACCNTHILNKPLNPEAAFTQLSLCSGNKVTFYTSLCLLNSHNQQYQVHVEPFHVYFRELTTTQIAHYIEKDQPFHCAGSFKAESLGIALFEKMEGDDPNSLIGLPLIKLIHFLQNEGIDVLAAN